MTSCPLVVTTLVSILIQHLPTPHPTLLSNVSQTALFLPGPQTVGMEMPGIGAQGVSVGEVSSRFTERTVSMTSTQGRRGDREGSPSDALVREKKPLLPLRGAAGVKMESCRTASTACLGRHSFGCRSGSRARVEGWQRANRFSVAVNLRRHGICRRGVGFSGLGISRSRQILLAKISLISSWRGTAETFFWRGFTHGVLAALAEFLATVFFQMADQLPPLHKAPSDTGSLMTSASCRSLSASSRFASKTNRIAS